MKANKQSVFRKHHSVNMALAGFAFIAAGLLIIGYNMGIVSGHLYHILLSWPMILVFVGMGHLLTGRISQAIVILSIGGFFLVPRIMDVGPEWIATYWPFFLIIGGIGMLLTLFRPDGFWSHPYAPFNEENDMVEETDGYITADASFSSIKHPMPSGVFKGAKLNVSFGSLLLDLRKTQLEAPETYITLSSSFGGVELYIPSSWNVVIEAKATFGSFEDKRFAAYGTDTAHKLVIRGSATFGGVEIKS